MSTLAEPSSRAGQPAGRVARVVISPMTPYDIADVMVIDRASFSVQWPDFAFQQELKNSDPHFYVAREATQPARARESLVGRLRRAFGAARPAPATSPIVGYVGMWIFVDEAHIGRIATHPDWRRRGIGEQLLLFIVDRARACDALSITLEVRPTNEAAKQLYLKHGFAVVGERRRYYQDNGEDALIMTRAF